MSGLAETDVSLVDDDAGPRCPSDQIRVEVDVAERHVRIVECRRPWRPDMGIDWPRFPMARLRCDTHAGWQSGQFAAEQVTVVHHVGGSSSRPLGKRCRACGDELHERCGLQLHAISDRAKGTGHHLLSRHGHVPQAVLRARDRRRRRRGPAPALAHDRVGDQSVRAGRAPCGTAAGTGAARAGP